MGKPRDYVIRTFEPLNEASGFDATGVMSKLSTFKEITVPKQFAAVAMLSQGQATPDNVRDVANDGSLPLFHLNDQDSLSQNSNLLGLEVIGFTIETDVNDQDALRDLQDPVREVIKTWAEKSRVKGVRGWRANAIKRPMFEMNKTTGNYDLKFEVILSTAIFYNQNQVTVSGCNFLADCADFKKRLNKEFGVEAIHYEHSVLGNGTL